jgi:hypothetical protein
LDPWAALDWVLVEVQQGQQQEGQQLPLPPTLPQQQEVHLDKLQQEQHQHLQ